MARDAAPGTGIVSLAGYLPWYRLTSAEIARTQRRPEPKRAASRRLAGYDEDALTMSVAAARLLPEAALAATRTVALCTATPPYAAKTNASAAAAALALPDAVPAYDLGGSLRSWAWALRCAAPGTLLLCADINTSRPGAPAELAHGDAAVACLTGTASESIAELVTVSSAAEEMLDHWRLPGQPWLSYSEERFGVSRYLPMLDRALAAAGIAGADHVIVSAPSARAWQAGAARLAGAGAVHRPAGIGYAGCADGLIQLAEVLRSAAPGDRILVAVLADSCDLVLLRCTERLATARPPALRAPDSGEVPAYLDALSWRGLLDREPPRRPEPSAVSPPASARRASWKYALHGSRCEACGTVSCPPQRLCVRCGAPARAGAVDLSRKAATIQTFSVDRLAYSPNPPVIAAVVNFDGGGRLEVELTDTPPGALAVGQRVRMTFRRRHSSGGIHNYAWKAVAEGAGHG